MISGVKHSDSVICTYIYVHVYVCVYVHMHKSVQSCPTLCNPAYSLPDSSVHGILQTRILEWVAIASSRGSSCPRDQTYVCYVSCIERQVCYHQRQRGRSIHILFQILFHDRLSSDTECRSLRYVVGLCCLSIMYISDSLVPNFQFIPPWLCI